MKLKLNFSFLFFITSITFATGQELDSISMTFADGQVVVRYDFLTGEEGVDYELYLYGSHDNFSKPLLYTSGDVGKNIQIGKGKVIYWDAKKELGNFRGDFSLKIRGSKYIPFVTYQNIHENIKIKRGESFNIRWKSSTKADQVLLKIQRNGVPISDPISVDNLGNFTWEVPANLKAGKGYSVQILDAKNLIREETSKLFIVRRKIPLTFKVIPIAVAAGAAAYLLTQEKDNGIPEPPSPPR